MLNNKQQQDIQNLLKKKQDFIQKAVKELQAGNIELSIRNIDIESGFNIELVKILEEIK